MSRFEQVIDSVDHRIRTAAILGAIGVASMIAGAQTAEASPVVANSGQCISQGAQTLEAGQVRQLTPSGGYGPFILHADGSRQLPRPFEGGAACAVK